MSHSIVSYKIKVVSECRYEFTLKLNVQTASKTSYRGMSGVANLVVLKLRLVTFLRPNN